MLVIDEHGNRSRAPSVGQIELQRNQWLAGFETAGGGYGDPLERDPEMVLEDAIEHYISIEHASDVYGVELTGSMEDESLRVDFTATEIRRKALHS